MGHDCLLLWYLEIPYSLSFGIIKQNISTVITWIIIFFSKSAFPKGLSMWQKSGSRTNIVISSMKICQSKFQLNPAPILVNTSYGPLGKVKLLRVLKRDGAIHLVERRLSSTPMKIFLNDDTYKMKLIASW